MKTLRRDGDEPSKAEEKAIETMRLREVAKLDAIDGRLERSRKRIAGYQAELLTAHPGSVTASKARANLVSERATEDRILDERCYAMGLDRARR